MKQGPLRVSGVTLSCGAVLPYPSGWMRPISSLSSYKIPSLLNVYLCGSGNHPGSGVSMAPGRNWRSGHTRRFRC